MKRPKEWGGPAEDIKISQETETVAGKIDKIVVFLRQYAKDIERINSRMREVGEVEYAVEVVNTIVNCFSNLRIDDLIIKIIRANNANAKIENIKKEEIDRKKCPVCKKLLKSDEYYCSEWCADVANGEGPRGSFSGRDDREGWGGSGRAEGGGHAHNPGDG